MNEGERHVTLGLIIAIIVILLIMAFLWGYPRFTSGGYYRTYERSYPVTEERTYRSSNGSSTVGSSYDYSSTNTTTTYETTTLP